MLKQYKHITFYLALLVMSILAMVGIVKNGNMLEGGRGIGSNLALNSPSLGEMIISTFHGQLTHPLAILLIQLITIIAVARLFGSFFTRIGQPAVVGEIIAGIALGPSLLGFIAPGISGFLFPEASLGNLGLMSQIGLVLFMFVIGMELNLTILRQRAQAAIIISHSGILASFTLGMGLSYFLFSEFAPDQIKFLPFALFMGVSMSITAFPVLARIIQERGLTHTQLGSVALTSAASDDFTAWCLLAVVIAIVKAGSAASAMVTVVLAIGYLLLMLKLVRPFLQRFGEIYTTRETVSQPVVAVMFIILLISSFLTELIGIHALYGAFMAGVIMPEKLSFRKIIVNKTEDVAIILLLPLFFVFTGLRTEIGLLDNPRYWGIAAIVIGVGMLGKYGGTMLASRLYGFNWKETLSIGALMNTRGLMELVVINIGYDLGVFSTEIFSILVVMALATTFMTGPSLNLINRIFPTPKSEEGEDLDGEKHWFRVLFTFANPDKSKSLLRLADLISGERSSSKLTAYHLTPGADISPLNIPEYESESFKPVLAEAKKLGLEIDTTYKVSNDVTRDILSEAERGKYDLLLVGAGRSIYKGTLLGNLVGFTAKALNPERLLGTLTGKEKLLFDNDHLLDDTTMEFIEDSECSVGVFLDKDFTTANKILLPFLSVGDMFMLLYARRLLRHSNVHITIADMAGILRTDPGLKKEMNNLLKAAPEQVTVNNHPLDADILSSHDLLLLSYPGWKKVSDSKEDWLEALPSTLVIRA
jgi:Kef-type K+ transport system membrane component KefB